MSDEEMDQTGNTDQEEGMEEDSLLSNDAEAAEDDHDEDDANVSTDLNPSEQASRSAKRKKGSKRGKTKKSRRSEMNVEASSTAELCTLLGVNDVKLEFTEEDYNNITNSKAFAAKVRPLLQAANPKVPFNKVQSVVTSKYKDYQEEMAAQGRPVPSLLSKRSRVVANDKVVAPIKIRISARKKKRNDEEDDDNGMLFNYPFVFFRNLSSNRIA
ncbi:hypothetical protein AB6A40_000991 [Gnathostoma spinigerum]|uniref:CHD N-terminal domain-containing protein n=1 Tax=Gnathostoma spinigerum TaxID=75299 RepID=A0ABD6EC69_9BILA